MIKTIRYKIKSVINFIKHFIFLFKQLGIISSIKFLKIENQDYTEKPYGDDKFTILNYRGGKYTFVMPQLIFIYSNPFC